MSLKKGLVLGIGTLFLVLLVFFKPLRFFDNLFYDLNFAFSSEEAADSVVVVAIDMKSISEIGAMPWPRSTMARLVELIDSGAPRALALDFLFPQRPDQKENDSLQAVFSRVTNLVLPFRAGNIADKHEEMRYAIPADIFSHRFMRITNQSDIDNLSLYTASEIGAADTLFSKHARYSGFLNVSTSNTSQKLREAIHVVKVGTEYFPSFGLAATAAYYKLKPDQFVLDGRGAVHLGDREVPLTSYAGTTFINFRGGAKPIKTISASEILNGQIDLSVIKDKLVFVGITDPAAGADFFTTPTGPQFPGVMVWATIALDIMQSKWIRYSSGAGALFSWLIVLAIFPGLALLVPNRKRFIAIAGGVALALLSVVWGFVIFRAGNYYWDPSGHLYAWALSIMWLAAQKADPSLGGPARVDLEPPDSIEEWILPPPSESDFAAELPQTDTAAYVTRTLTSVSQAPEKPAETFSGTIIEQRIENIETPHGPQTTGILESNVRELANGTIIKCLGSGGMADVYLVWNPRLEVYRAVKVIKPDMPSNLLTRFETEIRIFSKLDHPNIVHCYSVGEWHSLPYLEMEYVHGASLEDVLQTCRIFSAEQALAIGILVCRALHYAHNQTITIYGNTYKGIVHRDLKPANIMLGRNGRIKLTDFGIARPGSVSLHTMDTGAVVGTLPYLAPEQLEGGELTGQADVYALGITLYELLMGERAFPQNDIAALLHAKSQGKYRAIEISSRISKDVVAVITKAMSIRPAERYGSATAMLTDMEKVLFGLVAQNGYRHILSLVNRMWTDKEA